MSRPQLEVADIIRSAGVDFIARNRHGSAGPTLRSCWPSRAVAPPPSAAISISALAADIVPPSRTTAARNRHCPKCVRPVRGNAGSRHVAGNCCPRPTSISSSRCRRNWLR